MCMSFRESHLSGAEVVLCGLPPGWSFWNTASYGEIGAVSISTGLLALLYGIAKTCCPSVIECSPCLMLYVRRCSPEAPLRLSHRDRRNRNFTLFTQTSHFLVETDLPSHTFVRTSPCNWTHPPPVLSELNSYVVFMFSLGVVRFLRTVGVFSCALQDLSIFEVIIFTLSRLFISNPL